MTSNQQSNKPKRPNKFLQLTGVAFQMGATIFIGAYGGKMLDEKYPFEKKWFTMLFTLLGVGIALWNVVRQVNRINQEDDKK